MLNNKYAFKKTAILLALTAALGSQSVQAANWLMLQGTEKDHQAPRAKLWGFAQVDYQQTDDTQRPAAYGGGKAAFNQMAPQLTTSNGFNIKRARIGVRGANFPLDNKVNYFLMTELGNNGITTGTNGSQGQLTDASITLNHIPGARIRVGLFKNPGSEESFKAIPVFNYVNFTSATNRLLIERKIDDTDYAAGSTIKGQRTDSVFAGRDTGIQVFDSFKQGDWEHSYAVKYGNGNGLAVTDNDENKDLYLYASTEKVFGDSKGPRRHGMKFYAWSQTGKRTVLRDPSGSNTSTEYDRERSGLGMTYFDGKYRAAAEYIMADGMIFSGAAGAIPTDPVFTVLTDAKATGYHIDLGYRVKPNVELNARYDALEQAPDIASAHRMFTTTTLGAQYFFNKKTSVRMNYEIRDLDAPSFASTAKPNLIAESIDNRISAQLMMIF
jgi:predicted porin